MSINFIIVLISAFLSFITPPLLNRFLSQNATPFNGKSKQQIFLPLLIAIFIICSADYFIFFDDKDFLHSFNFIEFLSPFILASLLFLIGLYNKTSKFFIPCLALAVIIASFTIPADSIAAIFPLSAAINHIIIVIIWFLFSYIYRYTNNGSATLGIQTATITLGIAFLSLFNAIPFFLGVISLIFAAASISFSAIKWPPAKNNISDNTASCIGFIIFALITWVGAENAINCTAIFSILFIADFIWAALMRVTFIEQYSNIMHNTAYQQALNSGFSAQVATSFLCRAQIIIILLGILQAYSNQQYSLLLFSGIMAIWLLYKLRNLSQETKSIKDINQEVIADIQDRINDVKQYLNRENDRQ